MNNIRIYQQAEKLRQKDYMEFLKLEPETRAIWQAIRFKENLENLMAGVQPRRKTLLDLLKERFGK